VAFAGIYLLDVLSPIYHFSQLKMKVDEQAGTVAIVEYKYPGAAKQSAQYPIVLQAHGKPQYFEVRKRCLSELPPEEFGGMTLPVELLA
jgi:hypothetical protein